MANQAQQFAIQSTAGAVQLRNEKGKFENINARIKFTLID